MPLHCPECQSQKLILSTPRSFFERVLRAAGRFHCVCKACSARSAFFGRDARKELLRERARRIAGLAQLRRVRDYRFTPKRAKRATRQAAHA